ncbi:hypothetical protein [Azospirillum endophyticum]
MRLELAVDPVIDPAVTEPPRRRRPSIRRSASLPCPNEGFTPTKPLHAN